MQLLMKKTGGRTTKHNTNPHTTTLVFQRVDVPSSMPTARTICLEAGFDLIRIGSKYYWRSPRWRG